MASARQVRHIAEYSLLRVASCAFSKEKDLGCHQSLKGGLGSRGTCLASICIQRVPLGAVGTFQTFQAPLNKMLLTANI